MAKKFECEKCGANFTTRQNLLKHGERKTPCSPIVVDVEETGYQCKNCGRSFKQATNMYRHMRKNCKMRPGERAEEFKIRVYQLQEKEKKEILNELQEVKAELKELRTEVKGKTSIDFVKSLENEGAQQTNVSSPSSKKIPAALRVAVWNAYIGAKMGESLCFCCGLEPVLRSNYECGHIRSRAKGGPDRLENLRPVCSTCNKSMGTKNMIEFADKYGFPTRLSRNARTLTQMEEMLLIELYA